MHLDPFTLAFVSFLISIGQAVAFSLLLLVLRGRPAMRWWMMGWWLSCLGLVLVALRGRIPDALSILLGNGLFALSEAFLLRGLAAHLRRPFRWWPALVLIAALLVTLGVFTYALPDLRARLRIFAAQQVLWDLWAIVLLARHAGRDLRLSARLAGGVLVLDALLSGMRMLLPLNAAGANAFAQADHIIIFTYTVALMLGLGLMLSQILLVTERVTSELRHIAHTDGLTGLLNRSALQAAAIPLLAQCQNRGRALSVLLFDLDHFKRINDTWGHDAGDTVLRRFSRLLERVAADSPGALAGRQGGEEFLLVLPGLTGAQAGALAQRLRADLSAAPIKLHGNDIGATTSAGVATAMAEERFGTLVARADDALYRAKREGRDRICMSIGGDNAIHNHGFSPTVIVPHDSSTT